jgi:hypothetical protein
VAGIRAKSTGVYSEADFAAISTSSLGIPGGCPDISLVLVQSLMGFGVEQRSFYP